MEFFKFVKFDCLHLRYIRHDKKIGLKAEKNVKFI